jgi:predicted ATPase/class 3 adenylate cyclase
MNPQFPSGTVTFLFTDIEGSTRLAQAYPDKWEALRARHHAILRSAMEAHNGYVFQVIGDAFCVAFATAGEALRAALQSQQDLQAEKWGESIVRVRMGIHTGKAEVQPDGQYQGYLCMSRVQRVMSVAYGGQILVSNTSAELMRGELPEGTCLLDMQEHRLKGLLNPEHLWQAVAPNLRKDFPPLQSLNSIPNNLPVQLTSFIGREKEIAELKQELNDHHLVTLTGSGGTGKTRLSLQVAAEVLDAFPQGVWFLELAPVTDPALVPYSLANLLGLRESGDTRQSISETVCSYFNTRKALLVFDNCEHLIEACARLVDLLLRSCKDVKILATSREALGVAGEAAWRVPSLSLPDIKHMPALEQVSQYEAVRLFIDRAALVQPYFAVTRENAPALAQVCFRLDGIPLAIELAAARTNVLTLEQIAQRLDDRFRLLTGGARTALPRQQTLRAMIDWSYNLLSEEESLLFRRLAVFTGGWTLEAAEAVCGGDGIDPSLVLELLAQLVKKSLVVMTEEAGKARYSTLETIRLYGREKLFDTNEAARIRARHLDFFMQLAEQGSEELSGPNDILWIEKLDLENDNFRSALGWSLESPEADPQKALQLSGALLDFWDTRGYTREGCQWLRLALKRAPELATRQRCRALLGLGFLRIRLSQYKDARSTLEEALNLARQLNIAALIIYCLGLTSNVAESKAEARKRTEECIALARATRNQYHLGNALTDWSARFTKDAAEKIHYLQEAYEVAEELGNARLRAYVLIQYSEIEMGRANYASAAAMAREALRLNQSLKDRHYAAHDLMLLGRLATHQADHAAANQFEEESLQIFRDLSDRGCSLQALYHLGWNALLAGELDRAIELFEQCLSISRAIGLESPSSTMPMPMLAPIALGRIALLQGDIHKARGLFLEALEASRKYPDSTSWLLSCLEGVCAIPGIPPDQATRLLGKAEAMRDNDALAIPISERHLVEPIVERLQSQLGKEAFDSLRTAGRSLTFPKAVEEAIVVLQRVE